MKDETTAKLQSFDCGTEATSPAEAAVPRSRLGPCQAGSAPILQTFDCAAEPVPESAPAVSRPAGMERWRVPTRRYLEVAYCQGNPVAGYLWLPRRTGDVTARTDRPEPGFIVDRTADGRAIGVEITAPRTMTLVALNRVLAAIHEDAATPDEIAPLFPSRPEAPQH